MNVSVIIPGYNTPEVWWRRCVQSVIAAGANEVICVDDGSDKSPEFLSEYHVKVVFREKNGGLAAARNSALEVATGDYVTFVDSDDEVEPDTFTRCKQVLQKTQCDVAVYGVRVVWPDDGLQKSDLIEGVERWQPVSPENVLQLHRCCLLNYSCNKVYRRSFLQEHGLRFNLEGMPCEDIIFNLECLMAGASFCTVPFVGYVYYRTRGTLLSSYKMTSSTGRKLSVGRWRQYKAINPTAREVLGSLGEFSALQEVRAEWRNIWMPGTPYSFGARWRWLQRHGELGGWCAFMKMAFFSILRRYCYCRPIRRWNTRRTYPQAIEWRENVK